MTDPPKSGTRHWQGPNGYRWPDPERSREDASLETPAASLNRWSPRPNDSDNGGRCGRRGVEYCNGGHGSGKYSARDAHIKVAGLNLQIPQLRVAPCHLILKLQAACRILCPDGICRL